MEGIKKNTPATNQRLESAHPSGLPRQSCSLPTQELIATHPCRFSDYNTHERKEIQTKHHPPVMALAAATSILGFPELANTIRNKLSAIRSSRRATSPKKWMTFIYTGPSKQLFHTIAKKNTKHTQTTQSSQGAYFANEIAIENMLPNVVYSGADRIDDFRGHKIIKQKWMRKHERIRSIRQRLQEGLQDQHAKSHSIHCG